MPTSFMSDDYPAYNAAWCSVMGPVENRLLCAWHILHNWSKNLIKISDGDTRKTVKEKMREILKIVRESEFEIEYARFLKSLKEKNETRKYAEYLEENYSPRKKMWAYCYRTRLGINTNMHLESMHKKLKYTFSERKDVKRLDVALSCLLRMMFDYQFKRMISQVMGETSHKAEMNAQRQQRGLDSGTMIANISERSWAVPSSQGTDIYTVERNCLVKCCSNACDICNICIHVYKCDCPDNSITMAICRHIHAVHSLASIEKVENNLMIAESGVNEEQEILLSNSQVNKRLYSLPTHEWIKRLKMSFENIISLVHSSEEAKTVSLGLKRIQAQLKSKKKSSMDISRSPRKFGRPGNVRKQRLNWSKKAKVPGQLSQYSSVPDAVKISLVPETNSQARSLQEAPKKDMYLTPRTIIEEVRDDGTILFH